MSLDRGLHHTREKHSLPILTELTNNTRARLSGKSLLKERLRLARNSATAGRAIKFLQSAHTELLEIKKSEI